MKTKEMMKKEQLAEVDFTQEKGDCMREMMNNWDTQEPTNEELRLAEESVQEYEEEEEAVDGMQSYLKQIGRFKLLTPEEEQELGKRIKAGLDENREARNKLVSSNLRLVVHCAKRFQGRGVDMEDLNAMGVEGLIRAAEKYDYEMGYRFSTYAIWWINQSISRGVAEEGATVRVPVHMSDAIYKVKKAQKYLLQINGCEPTVEEIVTYSGLPQEKVMAALEAMYTIVSMDAKVGEDKDTSMEDFMADEHAESPEAAAMMVGLKEAVQEVLGLLLPKEATVLSLRYGIGVERPMTLEEIAKLPGFDVTRERIRQIENKAIRKIKRSTALKDRLRDFAS